MNPFSPGDRVQCKTKNRRNGNVVHIFCGDCEKCKDKKYHDCTNEPLNKVKVLASFPNEHGANKRFKYDYTELELEPPLPLKTERSAPDLSPRDIRPLGTVKLDVPLIVPDDELSEPELEVEEPVATVARNTDKPSYGMSFDQYVGLSQRMTRPI